MVTFLAFSSFSVLYLAEAQPICKKNVSNSPFSYVGFPVLCRFFVSIEKAWGS